MTHRTNGYARAAVHMGITLCLASAVWLLPLDVILPSLLALSGLLLIFEVLRSNKLSVNRLFYFCLNLVLRPEEWWHPTGAAYVVWGVTAAELCFPKYIAIAALVYLAIGDAASSIVGNYFNSRRHGTARLLRSLGCLTICTTAAVTLYYTGVNVSLPALLVGALTATFVESQALPVNDNVAIPVVAGLAMFFFNSWR